MPARGEPEQLVTGRRIWAGAATGPVPDGAAVCSAPGCSARPAAGEGEGGRWCPSHLAAVRAVRAAVTQRGDRWVVVRLPRRRCEP